MIQAPAFIQQLQRPGGAFAIQSMGLLHGDEPLFLRNALDAFRDYAKTQGYEQRERFDVESPADWQNLKMETQAGSLFADHRLLEVSLPKGSPGKEGSAFIQEWLQTGSKAAPEICILLMCEKLDSRQLKSKWVQAIEANGWVVQSRTLEGQALIQWCRQRAQTLGFELDEEAARRLAERVEGNLLAADQELEKLALITASGTVLRVDDIVSQVTDQAHYQLFALSTAMLMGRTRHALQILHRLEQEGLEPPVVLWLLTKELRQLVALAQKARTASLGQAFAQLKVWKSKQPELSAAHHRHEGAYWEAVLDEALNVDLTIKGIQRGDPWLGLSKLVAQIAA